MKWIRLFDFNSYFSTAGAILTSAAIGVAGAVYSGNEQKKAQEEAENEQQRLAEEARVNEQQILQQQALEAEQSKGATVEFGTQDEDDEMGTYDDFITPKQSKGVGLGGTSGTSGLGF